MITDDGDETNLWLCYYSIVHIRTKYIKQDLKVDYLSID